MYFTDSDSLADSTAVAQETGETDESDVSVELISDSLGSIGRRAPLEMCGKIWINACILLSWMNTSSYGLWWWNRTALSTISPMDSWPLPVTVKRANIYGGNIVRKLSG
jgi:hypothetical protein